MVNLNTECTNMAQDSHVALGAYMQHTPRFAYAVSNPPYQKTLGGSGHVLSIYPDFIYAASLIVESSMMVHPVRALRGAGRFNRTIVNNLLEDADMMLVGDVLEGEEVFPSADIRGGVIVTHVERKHTRQAKQSLGSFASIGSQEAMIAKLLPETLLHIVDKVVHTMQQERQPSIMEIMHSYMDSQLSDTARSTFPEEIAAAPNQRYLQGNIFTTLPELFHQNVDTEFQDSGAMKGYYRVLGRDGQRVARYIRQEFLDVPEFMQRGYRVFLPKANGNGDFGERLSQSVLGAADMVYTGTFLSLGVFEQRSEAKALQKYLHTRFARMLLGILKITQNNTRKSWAYVPLQDFTKSSDIDWQQSVHNVDTQLFAKYGLTDDEQQWVLEHTLSME